MDLKLSRNNNDQHTLYEYGLYAFLDYLDYRIKHNYNNYHKHPILDSFEHRSTIGKLYSRWIFTDVSDDEFLTVSKEIIETFIHSTYIYLERVTSNYQYTMDEREYIRKNRYTPENLISNHSIWNDKKQHEHLIRALIHANQEREDSLSNIHRELVRYTNKIPKLINYIEKEYQIKIKGFN